jgi:hypothetical protein
MFGLYITDIGQDRLRVIRTLAEVLRIGNSQAKELIDSPEQRVTVGDAKRIAFVRRELQSVGATALVVYAPDEMHPETWATDALSVDKVTCATCGAFLFYVVPGRTSGEEIVAFASKTKSPSASTLASERWMHPGVYCPNGCGFALVELEHPDQYTGKEP